MPGEGQLKYCRICKNRVLDINQGIICGLTNKPADFTITCNLFIEDPERKTFQEKNEKELQLEKMIAGQGKRFVNYLIDLVCFYIFTMIFELFMGILGGLIFPDLLSLFDGRNTLVNYLVALGSGMIYYTILEYATGRTLAKYITGTKVVDEEGNKPGLRTLMLRSLCRFIPFEPVSFLFNPGSGWHDRLSKTKVINIK